MAEVLSTQQRLSHSYLNCFDNKSIGGHVAIDRFTAPVLDFKLLMFFLSLFHHSSILDRTYFQPLLRGVLTQIEISTIKVNSIR